MKRFKIAEHVDVEALPALLTADQAAGVIGIPVTQLRSMLARNVGPASGTIGKRRFWPKKWLLEYVEKVFVIKECQRIC